MRVLHQRRGRISGLPLEDIQPGTADLSGLQRRQQRGLVDQPAPRNVDEQGTRLHRGELGLAEQALVPVMKHRAAHHRVRLAQQRWQLVRAGDQLQSWRAAELGPGPHAEQPAAERREAAGQCRADGTQAHDQDRRVEQGAADRAIGPAPLRQHGPGLIKPPGQGQQVQHRQLGAAVGIAARVTGDPGDQHAVVRGRPDVHAVQADAELMHQAERAGRDERRADPGTERAEDINTVEVVGDLARRAGRDLPAGQVGG